MNAVISAIIALGLTSAPPAEGPEPSEPLIRHSDQQARVQALLEEYAAHDEACSDDVDSAPLVVPIVDRGTLFGYAFVTPKLCLAGGVNRFSVLNDMHFIVDQMVRASHRTPFTLNADMSLDRTATNAAMLTAARSVIGEARVESLVLRGDDIRVLR